MIQNVPAAIVLAVISSFAFAAAATVQGSAVGRQVGGNPGKDRMPLSDLRSLVRAPRWLAGLVLAGFGSVLNAAALVLAPVTVVQPVGVLAVTWTVILAATLRHRPISRLEWFAMATGLTGIATFTALAASHVASGSGLGAARVVAACAVVYVIAEALGLLGARGRKKWRSLFWATGGAFFYGLEAALVRTMRDIAGQADWLHSPLFWGMAAAVLLGALRGAWMIQQAYATGAPETVVGALTVTNPVVAVLFGIAVLGEGATLTSGAALGMLVAAFVALLGVGLLSQADPATTPPGRAGTRA